MTKRGYARIISFALAVILSLSAFAIIGTVKARQYRNRLELSYQYSLNELSEALDSLETNLTKSVYASTPDMLGTISKDLYSDCSRARGCLTRLPAEQMELGNAYKFISQAADYANYLSTKLANGEEISDEEHKSLLTLLDYATRLKGDISSMVDICNSGGKILSSGVKNTDNFTLNPVSDSFSNAGQAFKDYPTLLYDGPFADAVLNREAQMIKNSEEITKEDARDIAANALGRRADELTFSGDDDGRIPCYVFTCSQQNIGVTKKGGYIAFILYSGRIAQTSVTEENAVNIAKKYLESIGYYDMSETYYMQDKNILTVNFAYQKDGITYYSDLIKVGVSMKDGSVVSLEAKGYLTNHTERNGFTEDSDAETLSGGLSPYLDVLNTKKCVIPLENGSECDCFEYHCKSRDTNEEVLIYVNAHTGQEENILLLLYSDGGTLTK